jgi:hypothetical protein
MYNFYFLCLEYSSIGAAVREQDSGEKHMTRPLIAEDGASLVWKARKQAETGCYFRSLAGPIFLPQSDLLSSEFTVSQFLSLDGMRDSSTLHCQEMNSEHLPKAIMDMKYLSPWD